MYTPEFYSAIKKEILPFGTSLDPGGTMLSERSQRTNMVWSSLYVKSKTNLSPSASKKKSPKLIEKERRFVVTRGRG